MMYWKGRIGDTSDYQLLGYRHSQATNVLEYCGTGTVALLRNVIPDLHAYPHLASAKD
jgi:hypothetical protein